MVLLVGFVATTLIATAIVLAARHIASATTKASADVASALGSVVETLGGIMQMTGDEPTYIPLEQFIEAQNLEKGPLDFDMTELVFEDEF